MNVGPGDYASKHAELDALMRRHVDRKDQKLRVMQSQLQDALYERQALQERVAMLMELLHQERTSSKAARETLEAAVSSDRKTLLERERRLIAEERDMSHRTHQMEEKEAYLRVMEEKLSEAERHVKEQSDTLNCERVAYESRISLAEAQMKEERSRLEQLSRELSGELEEARRSSEVDAVRRRSLDALHVYERRMLGLIVAEGRERASIALQETDTRGSLSWGFVRSIWSTMVEQAKQLHVAEVSHHLQADLLELKERELTARSLHERDALRDDVERFNLGKESFVLDCQSISRNIRAALAGVPGGDVARASTKALERAESIVDVIATPFELNLSTAI